MTGPPTAARRARRTDVQILLRSGHLVYVPARRAADAVSRITRSGLTARVRGVSLSQQEPVSLYGGALRNAYRLASPEARASRGITPGPPGERPAAVPIA